MTKNFLNTDMNILNIIDNYVSLLRSEIEGQQVGEYTELTFPFLDRNNDYLSLYIKKFGDNSYEISDGGQILDNLEMSGISLTGTKKDLAYKLAKAYGVHIDDDGVLKIKSSHQLLANNKHRLLQLMLKLDDLYYLSRSNVASAFLDEVKEFLLKHNIFFTPSISLNGDSGFTYNYDMVFQQSQNHPSRFCTVRNALDASKTQNLIFGWLDCQKTRDDEAEYIIIHNEELSDKCKQAFDSYDISYISYKNKEKLISALN